MQRAASDLPHLELVDRTRPVAIELRKGLAHVRPDRLLCCGLGQPLAERRLPELLHRQLERDTYRARRRRCHVAARVPERPVDLPKHQPDKGTLSLRKVEAHDNASGWEFPFSHSTCQRSSAALAPVLNITAAPADGATASPAAVRLHTAAASPRMPTGSAAPLP